MRTALITQAAMVGLSALVLIYSLFFHSDQYEDYILPAAVSFCVGIGLLMGLFNFLFLFFWVRSPKADRANNADQA